METKVSLALKHIITKRAKRYIFFFNTFCTRIRVFTVQRTRYFSLDTKIETNCCCILSEMNLRLWPWHSYHGRGKLRGRGNGYYEVETDNSVSYTHLDVYKRQPLVSQNTDAMTFPVDGIDFALYSSSSQGHVWCKWRLESTIYFYITQGRGFSNMLIHACFILHNVWKFCLLFIHTLLTEKSCFLKNNRLY